MVARQSIWKFSVVALLGLALASLGPVTALAQEADHGDDSHSEESHSESSGNEAEGGDAHAEGDHSEDHGLELHNDPTHANVSDGVWKLIEFRGDLALFTAVVFLVLLAVLRATAWKPIMDGLEKRERGIAERIANAEKASTEADAKLAEYEAKLANAAEEASTIVAAARKDAEAAGQKLVAEAQEDASRLRERATAEIDSAKKVALGELASQSTDVAMSLAQRIVGREVKAGDHQAMIKEMLAKLPSDN